MYLDTFEDIFGEFDKLVADRPYLQEETVEDIFDEFDKLVADRPYLQEDGE